MKREIVLLTGRVQGVGFRYQVAKIAQRFAIAGSVRNLRTSYALEIDVEGAPTEVDHFIEAVLTAPPPGGHIDTITRREAKPRQATTFEIGPTSD